jgi:thiol peroxidase
MTSQGKRVVLNIFPSIDTGVCATSVRRFNELAASLGRHLRRVCLGGPARSRWPGSAGRKGIENVAVGSTFRSTFPERLRHAA